jgi:hypothetical protein
MNGSTVVLLTIYLVAVILIFIRRKWQEHIKKHLLIGHLIFAALILVDLFLLIAGGATFKGIYFDRLIFWGLFVTAWSYFALFGGKSWPAKVYFGAYLFYPAIAMVTFIIDKILFVIVVSPMIVSLEMPEVYYSDSKFELRHKTGGFLTPNNIVLIEKKLLTESEIGSKEPSNEKDQEIKKIEIVLFTSDSINAHIHYKDTVEFATFYPSKKRHN